MLVSNVPTGLVTVADWLLPGITAPVSGKKTCKPLATSPSQTSLQFWWKNSWPTSDLPKYSNRKMHSWWKRSVVLTAFVCGRVKSGWTDFGQFFEIKPSKIFAQLSKLHKNMLHPKQHMVKKPKSDVINFWRSYVSDSSCLISWTLCFHWTCFYSLPHEIMLEDIGTKEPWILPTAPNIMSLFGCPLL